MLLPAVGRPLPQAADAYVSDEKGLGYVLAPDGHGADWRRVVQDLPGEDLWAAIKTGLATAPVLDVRDLGTLGSTCRVQLILPLGGREVPCRTIWHFAGADAAPRLVTAFPAT